MYFRGGEVDDVIQLDGVVVRGMRGFASAKFDGYDVVGVPAPPTP